MSKPWIETLDLNYDDAAKGIASVIWFLLETGREDLAGEIEDEFGVVV